MSRLIDTHSHLFVEEFSSDLPEVMERAQKAGVDTFVMPGINLLTLDDLLRVRQAYPDRCYAAIGLHPTEISEHYNDEMSQLKSILDADQNGDRLFRAIGEIGLDLYWEQDTLDRQTRVFVRQLGWALEYDLPVLIHSRNAFTPLCEILDGFRSEPLRGIFHCFSDGREEALRLMEYEGFMFGIGGVLTYRKSSLPEALKVIPRDRVVLETDCPYLAPVPNRGRRNEPSFMADTAGKLAEIWECPLEEVASQTTANACRLFGIQ